MEDSFREYQRHGWALVPLQAGRKAPSGRAWNRAELTLTTEEDVKGLTHAGLAHAYSGTCCLDIDDVQEAIRVMADVGIDLKALLKAPDAVRIVSGKKNRAKLLYALSEPLPSYKVILRDPETNKKRNIIDFRCATRSGTSVQDALPPTMHPDSGQPYRWFYNDELTGHWSTPPTLPNDVLRYWKARVDTTEREAAPVDREYSDDELRGLLSRLDPDTDYLEWINVGMALHHATEGDERGLDLWDEWSASGSKYEGREDLVPHWNSFQAGGISVDYLYMLQTATADDFDDMSNGDLAGDDDEEAAAKEDNSFQLVHVGEWVSRPPPNWLVDGLLPEKELAMIYGMSGTGKSFLALDIGMHIALGLPWREKEVVQGDVVWIAAEAAGSVRNRALAFAKIHGTDLAECPLWIIGDTPNLANVDHVRKIAKGARERNPKLVVVDTLAAASGGANENSGEDMGVILAACKALHKITKALVLLIHHAGKDSSKGARGWSGMRAAMETEIEVAVDATGERVARVAKQRDGEQDMTYGFKLVPVTLDPFDDKPQISCAVEAVDGVLVFDDIPHSGHISTAISIFMNAGVTTLSYQHLLDGLEAASRSAGEDKMAVAGELAQVPRILVEAGCLLDDGSYYTLINLPGHNGDFDAEIASEFD